jgi:hypothetical protein
VCACSDAVVVESSDTSRRFGFFWPEWRPAYPGENTTQGPRPCQKGIFSESKSCIMEPHWGHPLLHIQPMLERHTSHIREMPLKVNKVNSACRDGLREDAL